MKALYTNDVVNGPGHGFLHITGAGQIRVYEGLSFNIKRASDQKSLGKGGWQPAESFLAHGGISLLDEGIALAVGPEVVDNLDLQENYRITLKAADGATEASSLRVPEVAYSPAGGGQGIGSTAVPVKAPPPPPLPPAPEPEPEPEPEPALELELPPAPPPPAKSRLGIILLILALALAGGGFAAWKFLLDKKPDPAAEASPKPVTPDKPVEEAKPTEEAKPPLAQARAYLSGAADPAAGLAMAEKFRSEKNGADAAFLLSEDAAQKGNVAAMMLLAGFYDPADASPSGSIRKDPAEAFSWYAKAENAGNADAPARLSALRAWAEAEAAKGSAQAKELLTKFAR